ncbi:MAG: inverse autotransporter beta domain-containing protein, partial [Roseimicrobium sp.]
SLLFLEPYISWGEGGEVATSLGLGYRHLFGSQSVSALTKHDGHQAGFWEEGWYLGANVFVDMLDTEADNQFWQLGVGAEVGTRYIELRANYYIPLSEKQLAEERRSRETFHTQRSSSSTSGGQSVTPLNDPYATGNTVVQDAMFTNYNTRTTRTTTTTTTIERLFQRFEEGMEGWDAEVAILVPGLDRWMDVMIIGGYYSFDNQPFGPQQGGTGNVEGWKAGVEIRPVPALIFSGTWYEDERLTGSDWTVGVQMQIPFEAGDLGDGKNFWSRIGDSFKPRRRHLMERMAEPVTRQNTAVKIANSVKESEKVVAQKTSTSVKRTTRVVSQSQQHLVLADDIVFVNNDGPVGNGIQTGSSGGDGTAEHPVDTVGAGANLAGTSSNNTGRVWQVYTQKTPTTYVSEVALIGSVNFISSHTPIPGAGGTAFGGNTSRPVLVGGFDAVNIPFLGVTGYEIQTGIALQDIDLHHFGIHSVSMDGLAHTLVVQDNIISGVDDYGILATSYGAGTRLDVSIQDNSVSSTSFIGILLGSHDTSQLTANVTGNSYIHGAEIGLYAESLEASQMHLTIRGNQAITSSTVSVDPTNTGISLEGSDASVMIAVIADNLLIDGGYAGIHAHTFGGVSESDRGALLDLTITNNSHVIGYNTGINFESEGYSNLAALIENNADITGGLAGFFAGLSDPNDALPGRGARQNLIVTNNTIHGVNSYGFQIFARVRTDVTATLTGNSLLGGIAGIEVMTAGGASILDRGPSVDLTLTGNTATGDNYGFNAYSDGFSTLTTRLLGNTFTGSTSAGVQARSDAAGTFIATVVDGNTVISGVDGFHLDLNTAAGATMTGASAVSNTVIAPNVLTIPNETPLGNIIINGVNFANP